MTDPEYLKKRLEEAREAARTSTERTMGFEYCMKCDEHHVRTYDEESRTYSNIDCRWDHMYHVLTNGHDNPEITAWIDCLAWVLDEK